MNNFCGLDFGTSNTAVGVIDQGKVELIQFSEGNSIPSLIFFDLNDGKLYFGKEALNRYYRHQGGRMMKSLKSLLGTQILDDVCRMQMSNGENKLYTYKRIIGFFIENIKQSMAEHSHVEYEKVVAGRPVFFVDDDVEADKKAQNQLQEILEIQGFKEIVFQYEPLAALKTFKNTSTEEQIVLVIDIGGGTADFSLVRLPRQSATKEQLGFEDILANDGIHIGGDNIDEAASMEFVMPLLGYKSLRKSGLEVPNKNYFEISKLRSLGALYSTRNLKEVEQLIEDAREPELIENLLTVLSLEEAHLIRFRVENSKIELSSRYDCLLDLGFIRSGLAKNLSRLQFEKTFSPLNDRIIAKINNMMLSASIKPERVSTLFYTGGTTKIPMVRSSLGAIFKNATVEEGDTFSAVARGLAIEAAQIYR